MDERTLKFATWNIGGGILGVSHQREGLPSLDYHISILKEHEPDIVCLQEAHEFRDGQEGQPEYIARQAGYPHVASFPISESHMGENAYLSLGVLSRFPIKDPVCKKFPNPGLEATDPDGCRWTLFDKGYVECVIEAGGTTFGIVNAHCFPLHYFGARPTEPRFSDIWNMLVRDLLTIRELYPVLAALDLNYEPIQDLLTPVLGDDKYKNAFGDTPTTPAGAQQDYILYDTAMRLLASTVKLTRSDHCYCQICITM